MIKAAHGIIVHEIKTGQKEEGKKGAVNDEEGDWGTVHEGWYDGIFYSLSYRWILYRTYFGMERLERLPLFRLTHPFQVQITNHTCFI